MCRDHEACAFTYDLVSRRIVGGVIRIELPYIPFAAWARNGSIDGNALSAWMSRRAVPQGRENVSCLLDALGLESTEELMLFGLGLSLSDQYWLRPDGFALRWDDVKLFDREFPPEVGQALASHDASSRDAAIKEIVLHSEILSSSPDVALNGNLPKFWMSEGNGARLFKTGKQSNLMLEPFCEVAATAVCGSLLRETSYIPYSLDGFHGTAPFGSCPSFTDATTEFVPAGDIFQLAPSDNHLSRYERYALLLESRGIDDARQRLSEMLAVDHIIGNFDRHWGNFGVLVDAESREWLCTAPLFDMGESFDCDRVLTPERAPRKSIYRYPFLTRLDEQMGRYAEELEWFDPDVAWAAAEEALRIVCAAPSLELFADRYAEVERKKLAKAIEEVEARAREVRPFHPVGNPSLEVQRARADAAWDAKDEKERRLPVIETAR